MDGIKMTVKYHLLMMAKNSIKYESFLQNFNSKNLHLQGVAVTKLNQMIIVQQLK